MAGSIRPGNAKSRDESMDGNSGRVRMVLCQDLAQIKMRKISL